VQSLPERETIYDEVMKLREIEHVEFGDDLGRHDLRGDSGEQNTCDIDTIIIYSVITESYLHSTTPKNLHSTFKCPDLVHLKQNKGVQTLCLDLVKSTRGSF
jgi:hypothetical protein